MRKWDIIEYKKALGQVFFIIFFSFLTAYSYGDSGLFDRLETLDPQNSKIKIIRKDIRDAIVIIKKGGDAEKLPDLQFYKYKIKQTENFWKILSRTSMNIDTLASINSLSTPDDLITKKEIFLSNMRGIIYKVNNNDTIEAVSKKYNIGKEYILKVNKITENKINKKFIFIPSAEVSNLERSLFLGVAFASPLAPLEKVRRTSNFGRRMDPFNNRLEFHPGLDIACPIGSNVYAARKGKVIYTGYKGGYGLLIKVRHEHGYTTYYGHLKKVLKKSGNEVERGDLIALSGETGRCTGPHLHFEVRKQDMPVNPGILVR